MGAGINQKAEACDWTHGDVIDFERAVASALSTRDLESALRDDGRLLADYFPARSLDQVPRRVLFRRWLDIQRERNRSLFGRQIDKVFHGLGVLSWFLGCGTGFLGAAGYLDYNGSKPINVMWFLFWLVLSPLLMSAILAVGSYRLRDDTGPKFLGVLLAAALSRMSANQRELWQTWSHALRNHGSRLAPIAYWPLLGISQRFACGFGIGALVALFVHVIGADLAFGWESTLDIGAETVHSIAHFFASPWLWLFPAGTPTLEQVRDSRFTHLGGIKESAIAATRAWWPFLAGCLAVYAVGIRLLMVWFSDWKRRSTLAALDFTRTIDGALARRLFGPLFKPDRPTPDGGFGPRVVDPPLPQPPPHTMWMLLIAEGCDAGDASIKERIAKQLHGSVSQVVPIEIDYATGNQAPLESIKRSRDSLVVAIPAATDPIEAIRLTLLKLFDACDGRDCVIALLGAEDRQDLWRRWAKARGLDFDIIWIPQS